MRSVDPSISEAVYVMIYSAPRVDVQEITIIREQLLLKYGKELAEHCNVNPTEYVNPRVI
jgi:vacuolar protein sorting-associated protein IST1